jgi:hypothetical protein
MNEEILNKLHAALYPVSPLASDREKIIEKMGETIWLESLEKMLLALPEEKRKEVIELLNQDDIDRAVEIFEVHDVDIDAIITDVSTRMMDEVLSSIH